MTLYTFDKDAKNKSNCYDQCAKNWPPFMAAADAKAAGDWTIVDRDDGTKMWAYDGQPLYTFIKDTKPGDVTGDGRRRRLAHRQGRLSRYPLPSTAAPGAADGRSARDPAFARRPDWPPERCAVSTATTARTYDRGDGCARLAAPRPPPRPLRRASSATAIRAPRCARRPRPIWSSCATSSSGPDAAGAPARLGRRGVGDPEARRRDADGDRAAGRQYRPGRRADPRRADRQIVLSLARLNRIRAVDPAGRHDDGRGGRDLADGPAPPPTRRTGSSRSRSPRRAAARSAAISPPMPAARRARLRQYARALPRRRGGAADRRGLGRPPDACARTIPATT